MKTRRVALAAALIVVSGLGAETTKAEANPALVPSSADRVSDRFGAPELDETTVWVVNNYVGAVKVYAFGESGKRHLLGRVGHGVFQVFTLPERVLDEGDNVQIKVYPEPGHGSPDPALLDEPAIKSGMLPVNGLEIQVWVQPDLTRSLVAFERRRN